MNCPEIPVADKLAYPPIQVTEPNQRYAAILLQDLSLSAVKSLPCINMSITIG